MRLVFAAATDVGRMRKNNEDSYLSSKPVAAVADGDRVRIGSSTLQFRREA